MAGIGSTIRYKNDTAMRKRFFDASAFAHPAKMHGGLFLDIVERYTNPGDVILDVMGGIGTALLATMYSRSVVICELQPHFLETIPKSWAKIQRNGPALGHTLGQVLILRGDARHLPIASADHIVTSPPFQSSTLETSESKKNWVRANGKPQGMGRSTFQGYTRPQVDAVISSPPFQDQEATKAGKFADPVKSAEIQAANYRSGASKGHYASPKAILKAMDAQKPYAPGNDENIGNQKGDAYWESMRLCYQECHRVLRPGGLLVLVLKGFVRSGVYQDLPLQTAQLCEALGFVKFDEWRRELWSLSFWRILQQRRDPAAFDERLKYETVLAFRKGGADGNGIGAVVTSPPYEEAQTGGGIAIKGHYSDPKLADRAYSRRNITRPKGSVAAVITSPPYEGSLQGDEPSGKLFETERRVNSPASGNRKSKRKPLGQGYTRPKGSA